MPSEITQRKEVLHFKLRMWLKDWFSSIQNGLVVKKRLHLKYIYGTQMRTLEQEVKKHQGSSWNCLVQSSNIDGKRQTWLLEFGHLTPRCLWSHIFRNSCRSKTPQYVVFLGKTLHSHNVSFHLGVLSFYLPSYFPSFPTDVFIVF